MKATQVSAMRVMQQGTYTLLVTEDELPDYSPDVLLQETGRFDPCIVRHPDFLEGCEDGFYGYFGCNLQRSDADCTMLLVEPHAHNISNEIALDMLRGPFSSWYIGFWFGYISAYAGYVDSFDWESCLCVLVAVSCASHSLRGVA